MFAYVLLLLAVLTRVMPHAGWFNFTAVGGALLYFGARRSWREMAIPLVALMATDYYLTVYAYQYSFRWEGGQPGPLATRYQGEPDLTLTISPPDAQLVSAGQLQLSVAFMQGRLKTAGDNALLLELLAFSTDRPLPAPVWGPPASRGGSA